MHKLSSVDSPKETPIPSGLSVPTVDQRLAETSLRCLLARHEVMQLFVLQQRNKCKHQMPSDEPQGVHSLSLFSLQPAVMAAVLQHWTGAERWVLLTQDMEPARPDVVPDQAPLARRQTQPG